MKKTELKILFTANGSMEAAEDVCSNFIKYYPEFSSEMNRKIFFRNKETGDFKILWEGKFNILSEDDMNVFYRLTHHAEGFYEDVEVNYVHVEVCVNGIWFG